MDNHLKPEENGKLDLIWGAKEIAEELGLSSHRDVYARVQYIKCIHKIGGQLVCDRNELRRWLAERLRATDAA